MAEGGFPELLTLLPGAYARGGGGGALRARAHTTLPPEKMFRLETSKREKKVPPKNVGKKECMFRSDTTKLKR